MHSLIWPAINFSILLVILYRVLKKPLQDFTRNRHETLRTQVQEVRDLLRTSQEKYNDYSARLKSVDLETTTIREQAIKEGREIERKILEKAKTNARQIVDDTKLAEKGLYQRLKQELFMELGEKTLDSAEKTLGTALTKDVHQKIRKEFSKNLSVATEGNT